MLIPRFRMASGAGVAAQRPTLGDLPQSGYGSIAIAVGAVLARTN